jgi:hypothetical protein
MTVYPTDHEQRTVDRILMRLRGGVSAAGTQSFTGEQVIEGLRREAYCQEIAGAKATANLLDAAERFILALLIERALSRR